MSRRGPWTNREDEMLKEIVEQQGALNWVKIAQRVQTRSPKQCRERYHQNLKPGLNHSPITPEEGVVIEKMVQERGKRWAEIARALNNRSDNAVKNWWNGSMNRRQRLMRRAAENHHARVYGQDICDETTPEQSQASASYHCHDPYHRHSHSSYSGCPSYGQQEQHTHNEYYEQPAFVREHTVVSRSGSPHTYTSIYPPRLRSTDPSTYGITSPYNYQIRRTKSWDNHSELSGLPSPSTSSSPLIEPLEPPTPAPWKLDHSLTNRPMRIPSYSRESLPVLPPLRSEDSPSPSREFEALNLRNDPQPVMDDVGRKVSKLPPISECISRYDELHYQLRTAPSTPRRHPERQPEQPSSASGSPYSPRGDKYHEVKRKMELRFLAQ
ncbi:uncharacterized protein F4812DRAFT_470699 [Daldinia caldariorum]|uniref:uncharacterized protein n=1 Tax=Daldinia caldariorum TaxID=326644 RepID=UPI002007BE54|nr:uncharacterized protein F4812DRAFT_470699 [Daldinia caldariorum]KAI1468953.1 hypothetical protein F4812DRAFT_470699 [Daldinia caldariorum]